MTTAKLISYSVVPASNKSYYAQNMEDLIAYCARVSNPGNQDNYDTSHKLLKYIIREKHWSPFEMASACIEVTTTRDIARQLIRHRSFSFQEFSQRYADPSKDLNINIIREARLQDSKNRQNSIKTDDSELSDIWYDRQEEIMELVEKHYKWAIDNGIAKEQARAILPEGTTESRLYVNGTIRSWIHYVELRSGNGTQLEHRELAIRCAYALKEIFPMITNFIQEEENEK